MKSVWIKGPMKRVLVIVRVGTSTVSSYEESHHTFTRSFRYYKWQLDWKGFVQVPYSSPNSIAQTSTDKETLYLFQCNTYHLKRCFYTSPKYIENYQFMLVYKSFIIFHLQRRDMWVSQVSSLNYMSGSETIQHRW